MHIFFTKLFAFLSPGNKTSCRSIQEVTLSVMGRIFTRCSNTVWMDEYALDPTLSSLEVPTLVYPNSVACPFSDRLSKNERKVPTLILRNPSWIQTL